MWSRTILWYTLGACWARHAFEKHKWLSPKVFGVSASHGRSAVSEQRVTERFADGERFATGASRRALTRTPQRRRDRRELDNFADDPTFITTGSAYISGKQKLAAFYENLIGTTDSIHYDSGTPVVRLLDARNALVYFTWRVNWYRSGGRQSRLNDIGMMTVSAQKRNDRWLWVAITSQPFQQFFDKITDHQ